MSGVGFLRHTRRAFERFSRAVTNEEDAFKTVAAVQEALTHSAALSRFFWPARKDKLHLTRASKLCSLFKMSKSVLEQRHLRNALEHFDERLDMFLLEDVSGAFFPGPLVEPHTLADKPGEHIFRMVDPFSFVFILLGEKYEFLDIWKEVRRVRALATRFDSNGSRLRNPENEQVA